MSALVTEAHRKLVAAIIRDLSIDDGAQLIADSEARVVAAAVVTLEARITSDEELFHDIRMKLTAACGDPYKLHDEALDAIITERDQLRAEVERLKADGAASAFITMSCRASRAETDRNNLRADLDAIKSILNEEKARAELAEAELAGIRALADRRNERDHSQDTTHQLVAALDQALDIAQAELAQFRELDAERARMRQIAVDKRIRTPTPRTDEEAGSLIDAEEVVPADFARELERELAACKESLHLADGTANLALVHRDAAEAELATEQARSTIHASFCDDALTLCEDTGIAGHIIAKMRELRRAAIDAAMKEETK